MRDMPIFPRLKTSLIVLKILCLGSKYPIELVAPLLDKVTKSSVLSSNIGSKGYFLLLNGSKCDMDLIKVSEVRLGGRTRSARNSG